MTHHLSGINQRNEINLTGKKDTIINTSNYKIKTLKSNIISQYLVPLFSKQWDILNENIFFIDKYQEKLNHYYKSYKLNELVVYIELLNVLKLLIENHNLLVETEGNITSKNGDPTEIITMIYKTTKIRLIPEYEIYNSILGRPKREKNEKYNEDILYDIKKWLSMENTSFKKIKKYIEEKYMV